MASQLVKLVSSAVWPGGRVGRRKGILRAGTGVRSPVPGSRAVLGRGAGAQVCVGQAPCRVLHCATTCSINERLFPLHIGHVPAGARVPGAAGAGGRRGQGELQAASSHGPLRPFAVPLHTTPWPQQRYGTASAGSLVAYNNPGAEPAAHVPGHHPTNAPLGRQQAPSPLTLFLLFPRLVFPLVLAGVAVPDAPVRPPHPRPRAAHSHVRHQAPHQLHVTAQNGRPASWWMAKLVDGVTLAPTAGRRGLIPCLRAACRRITTKIRAKRNKRASD